MYLQLSVQYWQQAAMYHSAVQYQRAHSKIGQNLSYHI